MQQQLVSDLLERAFGGAARKLVAALTSTDISDEELADIRRFLNEHRERSDGHAD
jgi:predicted transcriptional regulator